MSDIPAIDEQFLEPLEGAMLAIEVGQIPLLIFSGGNSRQFFDQVSAIIEATFIYFSQKDFGKQFRHSVGREELLFVKIDQLLAGEGRQLIDAYLAWRDVMGPDPSQLEKLGIERRAKGHRLGLLIDKQMFDAHDGGVQHRLAEFCRIVGVR